MDNNLNRTRTFCKICGQPTIFSRKVCDSCMTEKTARYTELLTNKIPHALKMFNYWTKRAVAGERGAKKSAKLWEDAVAEYTAESKAIETALGLKG